ncbi:Transcription factor GRAS [Corchorus olitorius]|uniref:Transcription factor GRAS n=1 Tax=Corchorus olitorius TaxID=93759 RepID=A0A1R3KSY5_9ROSI|nr:Transcription factor GRAS [Corchorus olitorius]
MRDGQLEAFRYLECATLGSNSDGSFDDLRKLGDCARALEDGDLTLAHAYAESIWTLAPNETETFKDRLVKYYVEALVVRAYGLHPCIPYFNLKASHLSSWFQ